MARTKYEGADDTYRFVDKGNEDLARLFDEIEAVTGEQPPRTERGGDIFSRYLPDIIRFRELWDGLRDDPAARKQLVHETAASANSKEEVC